MMMLTQKDLNAFEKLIDKKTKTIAIDIAAIETRLRDLEKGQTPRLDHLEVRSTLRDIEKRLAALETTVINRADLKNFATKSDIKNFVSKKDLDKSLKSLGNQIIKNHLRLSPLSS